MNESSFEPFQNLAAPTKSLSNEFQLFREQNYVLNQIPQDQISSVESNLQLEKQQCSSQQYIFETSPFISNLYKSIDEQKFKTIINWSDNGGHYFVIYSMEKFKQLVLPIYFTTTSYSTFVRQLNKYGFRKVNIKKDEHIFYHPIFRADNKSMLHTIKRKRKGKDQQAQDFDQKLRAEILKQEEFKTLTGIDAPYSTQLLQEHVETIQQRFKTLNQDVIALFNLLVYSQNKLTRDISTQWNTQKLQIPSKNIIIQILLGLSINCIFQQHISNNYRNYELKQEIINLRAHIDQRGLKDLREYRTRQNFQSNIKQLIFQM
ncbi:stress response regulator hfs transcription [Stylonychia lemnae]|uniref:Stress response regulator hfs transcription n=1 Tax=Stylonychia lemnae TaxID=5949 RepID=A0A077ZSA3_STYLE|nr:stress response regulator hfs transcription [Stylonychia lemnae]|eukprot:CDW71326.1 stress response regulator hfs transcription [Stylonychia lemnae]